MSAPALWAVGVDVRGRELTRRRVRHGASVQETLAAAGFATVQGERVDTQGDPHELSIVMRVRPGEVVARHRPPTLWDPDLVVAPGEVAVRAQRVAVNALVRSQRGVLLTEYSERTNVAGTWGPPGGGIDPGESAEQALAREVHEETGQRVQVGAFVGVLHGHWLGRAPDGVLEDFHLVRLVYLAACPQPADPVVHDVGGTTSAAAWVGVDRIPDLPLASGWADLLRLVATD